MVKKKCKNCNEVRMIEADKFICHACVLSSENVKKIVLPISIEYDGKTIGELKFKKAGLTFTGITDRFAQGLIKCLQVVWGDMLIDVQNATLEATNKKMSNTIKKLELKQLDAKESKESDKMMIQALKTEKDETDKVWEQELKTRDEEIGKMATERKTKSNAIKRNEDRIDELSKKNGDLRRDKKEAERKIELLKTKNTKLSKEMKAMKAK